MTRPDRDVMLCRGCCCGTEKHPDFDHTAQRQALQAAGRQPGARVRVVDCLDECDHSNVVLLRDFTRGRRPVDTWLGGVLSQEATRAIAGWIRRGGAVPESLAEHEIERTRSGRLS